MTRAAIGLYGNPSGTRGRARAAVHARTNVHIHGAIWPPPAASELILKINVSLNCQKYDLFVPRTLQYMAPEIIDKGPRGYGAPADIWSLGCTIIEMATGKPPFHELGEPQAAMFKVGMFKIHPEIPESLSLEAKSFILSCFEPDPNKRAITSDLLKDSFLQCEATGSSSSEPGSMSPDCDSKHDVFFVKKKKPGSENLLKPPNSNYLSVPYEGSVSDDRSAPPSPEDRDGGLFLLKKDSERRAILFKVLNDDQAKVISNLKENHIQVNKVLRNHHIKPHWMFAMDNIIRRAVQAAITILIPELQTHFGPASESEGAEKEDEVDEEEAEFGPVLAPQADDAAAPADSAHPVVTAPNPAHSPQEPQRSHHHLRVQLGRLKHETNRLLEELLQKEKEFQQVLKATLQQRTHDMELVRARHRPLDILPPSIFKIPADHEPDKQLTDWLKEQGADADTVDKFVLEEYTLTDVLAEVTKDDLQCLRLRGGVLCRIWRAIQRHRERERLRPDERSEDDA
ncbi:Mitogen-activated protein kinase kinase kinase 15 [Liparis tanakae]|uniref:Mitogen-activated protein kinase kinase kinase 15 n=1 Tax=Liparis tanakae TaxID=230148 RepID=A0A4Z2FVW0_9TELE|nr:Mitogen-activated protein kinase kinase kinase 15 [Liparis tanakae]